MTGCFDYHETGRERERGQRARRKIKQRVCFKEKDRYKGEGEGSTMEALFVRKL